MELPLVKRVVLETPLYYDEELNNYVAVHPEDDLLSREKQLEIGTKHGFFNFVILVKSFVTVGSIALNYQQRKKYHLKFYRRYVKPPPEIDGHPILEGHPLYKATYKQTLRRLYYKAMPLD